LACLDKFFLHNLDVKEGGDHAFDIAFHLSGLFGLSDVGLFHWKNCCFVSAS
jgi:hypothetical protein